MGPHEAESLRAGRRRVALDVAVAGAVAVAAGLGLWQGSSGQAYPIRPADLVAYLLVPLGAVALALRRSRPLSTLTFTVAVAAATLLLRYPYEPFLLAVGVAMYSVASHDSWQYSVVICAAACMVLVGGLVAAGGSVRAVSPVALANVMCFLALPCAIGRGVRSSRGDPLRFRAEEIRLGVDAEQRRIAHDIYETVGQGLAAINIHATATLRLAARQPERVLEMLQTITNESRAALQDLRAVLGTPVHPVDRDVRAWQLPGLRELPALLSAFTGSGLAVEVVELGTRSELSVAVDLAAFRIVQRSLANVLWHASSTTATVRIEHGTADLTLQITDNRDEEAGSRSLPQETTGIGEQVIAMGGEMEAGPRAGGGFQIRVRLPAW